MNGMFRLQPERAGMHRPPQAGQRFDAPLGPAQTDSAAAPLGVGLSAGRRCAEETGRPYRCDA